MSRRRKLQQRLLSRPRDFTWDELSALLNGLGYLESKRSKTGGSRRTFFHPSAATISLHKPHPKNIVKTYVINDLIDVLKKEGLL